MLRSCNADETAHNASTSSVGGILPISATEPAAYSVSQHMYTPQRSYADAHGNMAGVLLQQQKMDEAATHYTRALELNENNACWLVDLGHINRVRNNRSEAKMCFIKATHVNPDFAIAFSNLACIFKDEGTCHQATFETVSTLLSIHSHMDCGFRLCVSFRLAHLFASPRAQETSRNPLRITSMPFSWTPILWMHMLI